MPPTKQITVRLPEDLVDWLDEHLDDQYPSRAALITQALRRAKRRQESRQDLAKFLAFEALPPTEEEMARLEWMESREYPDMGEAPGILNPNPADSTA